MDVTGEINQRIGAFYFQSLGDQNGDGFDDILTTVRSSQNSVDLRLYYGNNANEEDFIDFGRFDTTNDRYGWSDAAFDAGFTVPSGDLNGDGFRDILLSLYRRSVGNGYSPALFLGGPGVFDTLADWSGTLTDLIYITNVGDYNGDGKDDYTSRPLSAQNFGFYLGGVPPLSQIPEWEHIPNRAHMGFGDVNGDGFSDFGMSYFIGSQDLSRMDIFFRLARSGFHSGLVYQRPRGTRIDGTDELLVILMVTILTT
ncbi:MAG: VCBS repeat-containing protein [bacterium]|nr:VCBS repeat-containing protein [bacterium]